MSINRHSIAALLLLAAVSGFAQESGGGKVPRTVAVVFEDDHPQVLLLARSLEAELVNMKNIRLVDEAEAGDAVLYVGRLELGSRASLWVRGMDRLFDDEVFTETLIFQDFDARLLLNEFLPKVLTAVRAGFPPLEPEVAAMIGDQPKGEIVFPDQSADMKPVTLVLEALPGTRLSLRTGTVDADPEGRLRVRALPGTLLSYRAEAPGHVPKSGEILVGNGDETRPLEFTSYAGWALELKLRLWEMGVIPGLVWYLLDEEIYLYASLEQNIISLGNLFSSEESASPGFLQPVVGIGGYSGAADSLIRPFMGFGFVTRFVSGETRSLYLSKTMTAGIDFSMGLDIDPFKREDLSIVLNYTPRIFYSSFYARPFDDYYPVESPPAHLEGHWFLQWAGPVNIGVRWEL
jgi:hypothetical protein